MAENDLKARVAAARAEGYTDAEIAQFLVEQGEIDTAEALKEGYTETEILDFLVTGKDPQRRLTTEPRKDVSRTEAVRAGLVSGFENVSNTLAEWAGDIADKFNVTPAEAVGWAAENLSGYSPEEAQRIRKNLSSLPGFGDIVRAGAEARQSRFADAREQRPNYFTGGQIGGEIFGTAPFIFAGGGALARGGQTLQRPGNFLAAQKAGGLVERIGRAVQSGGLGSGRTATATVAAPRGQRIARLSERMVGGGIGGAAGAAMTGQDAEGIAVGGAFGAGLPVVASVLKRVGGFAGDITQMPRQKAAQIIRKSLGDNLEAARAEFARLSPDDRRLAEQVLVEAGIEPDTFYGLGGIAQRELQPPGVNPMRATLEEQAAARESRLAEAAGGPTMESVRAAERQGRQAVTEAMAPIREAMYERAGVASREVPEYEARAAAAEQRAATAAERAAQQSALARRMTLGAERAETTLGQMDDLGDPFAAEAVGRQRSAIDWRESAKASLREARDMYDVVDDLAAQGMEPMRAADLIASLRQKMRDPEILAGSMEERVIKNVIRQIEKGTDANGMLNPRTLGKIRRSGLNEIVQKLSTQMTGGPSRTGTPEAAQSVVLDLRKMIDTTLKRGGAGDLVDQFIEGSERGYAAVNRQRLAGEALRLYKDAPAEFEALVRGDRPQMVSKIMKGGPEKESIAGAFEGDPQRLAALQQSARELETLNRMNELRSVGASPAANLMIRERPSRLSRGLAAATLSPFPAVRIGAVGAEQVEKAVMAPKVQRQIAEAFTSGQAMNRMLQTVPASARISEQFSRLPSSIRNMIAQSIINRPPPQPMIGEGTLNEYDEFGNPLFDEQGNYIGPR